MAISFQACAHSCTVLYSERVGVRFSDMCKSITSTDLKHLLYMSCVAPPLSVKVGRGGRFQILKFMLFRAQCWPGAASWFALAPSLRVRIDAKLADRLLNEDWQCWVERNGTMRGRSV